MTAKAKAATVGLSVTTSPKGGHLYFCDGKGPLPGATSITGLQEAIGGSDGLLNWAVGLTVRKAIEVYSETGDPDQARSQAWAAKNEARDLGSAVHKAVEAVNLGRPFGALPADVAQHVAQYAAFLVKHDVDVLAAEQMVANLTLGYGGSFDLYALIDGQRSLLDVKTGKSRPSHRLQLAGYAMAEVTGREGEDIHPMPEIDVAQVLLLRHDSFELVTYQITDEDREHFAALVGLYHRAQAWRTTEDAA
jgi:hypothetical protein